MQSICCPLPILVPRASSETQGQIVGARESLNGRENKARRKVKNGKKSPWGNVLPDQFQTVAAVLASDWCQKICVFPKKASALAGLRRTGPFRIIKVLF